MILHRRYAGLPTRLAGIALGLVLSSCGAGSHRAPSGAHRDAPLPPAAAKASPSPGNTAVPEPVPVRNGDGAAAGHPVDVHPPSAARPATPLQVHRLASEGITLSILTFDRRSHSLAVLDNDGGPGTGATSSQAAARTTGSIAAINAGFFTPEGQPLGLVIEDGTRIGSLNSSSLGAGFYVQDPESRSTRLTRRPPATGAPRHLLQSGPFLVEHREAVRGLSTAPSRPRSFLLWDGHDGWAIGHARTASLAELAASLARQPVPGFTIESALNLDGGTSADLWIASSVKGGPVSTRRLWNKPVRNYLVLQRIQP